MTIVRYVDRPGPARTPSCGAFRHHLPEVHAPQRARQPVLGPALQRLPGVPGRSRRRRRAAGRGACGASAVGRYGRRPPVRVGGGVRARHDLGPGSDRTHGDRHQRRTGAPGREALRSDDPDVHRQGALDRSLERDRACSPHVEGALSAHPHRALRRVATRRRVAFRSLDPHPRARRRRDPGSGAGVDDDPRSGG